MRDSIKEEIKLKSGALKSGVIYKSGTALKYKSAKNVLLESQKRRTQQQLPTEKTYRYYSHYYIVGHLVMSNRQYEIRGKTKIEKDFTTEVMEELMIEQ